MMTRHCTNGRTSLRRPTQSSPHTYVHLHRKRRTITGRTIGRGIIICNMVYTLDWLRKEAEGIVSSWNGSDDTFMYDGDLYPAEQADTARELLEKLNEVDELIKELSL